MVQIPYGKWNLMMLANALILVGCGLCLVDNIYVVSVGRFIWGMAAGAFTVFCPKYGTQNFHLLRPCFL